MQNEERKAFQVIGRMYRKSLRRGTVEALRLPRLQGEKTEEEESRTWVFCKGNVCRVALDLLGHFEPCLFPSYSSLAS